MYESGNSVMAKLVVTGVELGTARHEVSSCLEILGMTCLVNLLRPAVNVHTYSRGHA
jgi:hypothetical protein